MTSEEFTDVVSNDNVLTKAEIVSVYQTITKKTNVSKFKNEARGMTKSYLFVRAVEVHTTDNIYYGRNQNGLTFKVSTECTMTLLTCFFQFQKVLWKLY
ncbi:hypothetical protein DPMN_146108 [Dreissena polymorpha]|uniref:Uncharacterized protein n=1 Tax=Dreissena polymorpha TaxID=45954 RepID=A0A9D4F9P9_DREPO|nr:hypothetical protein DPMN_146108 [Dreissena polymorpha]